MEKHFFLLVLVALFVCSARSGLGLPCLCCFWVFLPSCAPPLSLAFRVFRPGVPWALASCGPSPPSLLFFFSPPPPPACLVVRFVFFFRVCFSSLSFFRAVLAVRCRAGVSWSVGRVGVCCCGPGASAGAGVRLRSVVRCSLPVPSLCVLLPVVLCVPVGAVLAALLFPLLPCGVARPTPWALRACFFFASGLCWLSPPLSAAGCAVLC